MIPVLLGAAALFGAAKTIDAMDDMDRAKRINREAKEIVDSAKEKFEMFRDSAQSAIENLGDQKFAILTGSLTDFVDSFSQIKNVDISETNLSSNELTQMQDVVIKVQGTNLSSDDAFATGAFNTRDQTRLYAQKIENTCGILRGVERRANQINRLLGDLDFELTWILRDLEEIIDQSGTNYRNYSPDQRFTVATSAQLAKTIKIVIDAPLLLSNGSVDGHGTKRVIETGRALIRKLN